MNRRPASALLVRAALVLPVAAFMASCASLIQGEAGMTRPVVFTSSPPGALIIVNDVPQGTTPTVITFSPWTIARAKFTASKPGYQTMSVDPGAKFGPGIVGNIILGGVGGILIDGISGSAIRNAKHVHIDLNPE